jgi:oligopeptide transport system substrate-binding protein
LFKFNCSRQRRIDNGGRSGDRAPARIFTILFYSKSPAPPNYTRFKNKAYDELYEKALAENNDSLRMAYHQQMDRILIEEAPVVFLFYDETALFAKRGIRGLSRNGVNLLSVKRVVE